MEGGFIPGVAVPPVFAGICGDLNGDRDLNVFDAIIAGFRCAGDHPGRIPDRPVARDPLSYVFRRRFLLDQSTSPRHRVTTIVCVGAVRTPRTAGD